MDWIPEGKRKVHIFIITMEKEDKDEFKKMAKAIIESDIHNKKTGIIELCRFIDNFDRGR